MLKAGNPEKVGYAHFEQRVAKDMILLVCGCLGKKFSQLEQLRKFSQLDQLRKRRLHQTNQLTNHQSTTHQISQSPNRQTNHPTQWSFTGGVRVVGQPGGHNGLTESYTAQSVVSLDIG